MNKPLTIIGRAQKASFPSSGLTGVPVKVDTGAYRSSVWATGIKVIDGVLHYRLLGKGNGLEPGTEQTTDKFELVEVENSFGHKENRYSVYLSIVVCERRVRTNFTLSDRSKKTYPVLLGRKLLRGKFLVDVSKGSPIPDEENE